ncbi:uncharacterized protein N7496_003122 [Penicillium cataractarum]|uniref:DUF6606 domain-containing protein n=1 Tax=Penicillium cataractarum TaxID=2100454 RepID=A0A9W9VH76_9EURO|nr:uncharacterized protein N7496_003122 [Penicillium cataractarum]KAJ5380694.1 hypothetical protein N7496_003122 [Penicillium cataractarum]
MELDQELAMELERKLLLVVLDYLRDFIDTLPFRERMLWNPALKMLDNWVKITTGNTICSLADALYRLTSTGAIACHIRAQNCGLVATYDSSQQVVILEAFEVCAQDEQVLAAPGALMRRFPGVSVVLPAAKMAEPTFRSYLATSISQLDSEEVSAMRPKSKKAGTVVDEFRDTAHPGLVTEGLMTQLLAFGKPRNQNDLPITKSVRDEVNWRDAYLPWRRSPAWLVLRVAIQLTLRRSFPPEECSAQYKNFLLYLMAGLGSKASSYMPPHTVVDGLSVIRTKLGRRAYKLHDSVFPFVSHVVYEATKMISDELLTFQQLMKDGTRRTLPQLPTSVDTEHCCLSLPNCKQGIYDAMHYSTEPRKEFVFSRKSSDHFSINEHGFPALMQDSIMALNAFEKWVEETLQPLTHGAKVSWMTQACYEVEKLAEQYFTIAAPRYADNPPARSLMMLTILELWVAVDKMGNLICPLVKDFPPEIPANFLDPLLLPKWSQMQRAERFFDYIRRRRDSADPSAPSIFSDPSARGFAVRYYDVFPDHQSLRAAIETYARSYREMKEQELARLTSVWLKFRDDANNDAGHFYGNSDTGGQMVHETQKLSKMLAGKPDEWNVNQSS